MKAYKPLAVAVLSFAAAAANAACDTQSQAPQKPNAAEKFLGDLVTGVVKGQVREATKDVNKAVKGNEAGKYVAPSVNRATRGVGQQAEEVARNGTQGAVSAAKGAFEDCSPQSAGQAASQPAARTAPQVAPVQEAASAPANDPGQQNLEALKGAAGSLGGWLKKGLSQ